MITLFYNLQVKINCLNYFYKTQYILIESSCVERYGRVYCLQYFENLHSNIVCIKRVK